MVVDVDICGLKVGDEHPVHLMGVINLSRESFYKGSVVDEDHVLDVAWRMVDEGASIIDLGARSTWPLADPITKKEECTRLLPALRSLKDNVDVVVSVDTMFCDIADRALQEGADIINDVAGFAVEGGMPDVVASHNCPAVVMAAENVPGDLIGMDAIMHNLDDILLRSADYGIDTDRLILDPAIGKWVPEKLPLYDLETLDRFDRLQVFEKPLLAAISRKSFIGDILGKPATERLNGSLAAAAIAVHKGAHIIRTHDVAPTLDVVRIAAAIRSRQPVAEEQDFEVRVLHISSPDDSLIAMRNINVTGTGARIMRDKTVSCVLRISNITTTEALIIKQEMLARGGDAALEQDAVSHEAYHTDVIVMGTLLQLKKLSEKLTCQARSLPLISKLIMDCLETGKDVHYSYRG